VDFDPADPSNLLYALPPEYWKIFVSSKMVGGALSDERAAAIEAIDEFPLTRAWAWERDAHAGPYSSERECVAQAGTSDGLVLIVDDELTPVTRKEFEGGPQRPCSGLPDAGARGATRRGAAGVRRGCAVVRRDGQLRVAR
jgi:hypothetical protein